MIFQRKWPTLGKALSECKPSLHNVLIKGRTLLGGLWNSI